MAKTTRLISPRRGEVYLVNVDPTIGAEIQKTRPALILQNDIANRHSPITIVAAISSKFDEPLYPTEVLIAAPEGGLRGTGAANQSGIGARVRPPSLGRRHWYAVLTRRGVARALVGASGDVGGW